MRDRYPMRPTTAPWSRWTASWWTRRRSLCAENVVITRGRTDETTHTHQRTLCTVTRAFVYTHTRCTHTLTHSHTHLQTYTRTHLQTHEHTRHTHTVAHVGSLAGYNGSNSRETSGRLTRVDGTSPTRAPPNVCATYPAVAAADNKCFLTARRLRVWLTVPPPSSPRSNTDGRPRGAESPRLRLRDPSARQRFGESLDRSNTTLDRLV